MSEWLKEHAWKVCISAKVSRVRIPHSPHGFVFCLYSTKFKRWVLLHRSSADLDKRRSKYFDGMSKYSSSKRPLRLRYFELFPTRSDAIKREKEIKRRKSRIYIELLIKNWLKESRVLFSSGFSIK